MRIHLIAAILAILLSFFLQITTIEWCLILICIFLVMAAEIFNSAIEYGIDLVTKEKQDLAKKAKDAAAGAVLVLAFLSLIVGAIVFIPKILMLVKWR